MSQTFQTIHHSVLAESHQLRLGGGNNLFNISDAYFTLRVCCMPPQTITGGQSRLYRSIDPFACISCGTRCAPDIGPTSKQLDRSAASNLSVAFAWESWTTGLGPPFTHNLTQLTSVPVLRLSCYADREQRHMVLLCKVSRPSSNAGQVPMAPSTVGRLAVRLRISFVKPATRGGRHSIFLQRQIRPAVRLPGNQSAARAQLRGLPVLLARCLE